MHSLLFTVWPTIAQLYQNIEIKKIDTGQARPQHQQRLYIQPLRKPFITLYNQHFIEVYHFIFYQLYFIKT